MYNKLFDPVQRVTHDILNNASRFLRFWILDLEFIIHGPFCTKYIHLDIC